jgi:pyrroline-5-carboxylate reductase
MKLVDVAQDGLVLVGCGRMGGAMLDGWLERGLPPQRVWVVDPNPSERLSEAGVHVNGELPSGPGICVVAVKPQRLEDAIPTLAECVTDKTLVVSVVAGVPIQRFEVAGARTQVVRVMPNTPAAIGQGITALIANEAARECGLAAAEVLMSAVGETVRLDDESQMDAVTAVSGSGPAYVFHLIETMAAAGEAEGLGPDLALKLARATVAGAGALAVHTGRPPGELREAVTSPAGTTAAALAVLMDETSGLPPLMRRAVHAAAERSRELGQ